MSHNACLKSAVAKAVLLAAGISTPLGALAQLEEVVVTAQKKEESLQDTPIAISAFTAENLEQIGALSAVDVGDHTPNAWITRSLGSNSNIRVSIRGIGTAEPSLAVDPKVGIYLDGAYIARNSGAVFDVVDLERIEVLRGPQGTLWGKNTTGGAMNLITKKPSGELSGKVEMTAGNDGLGRAFFTLDTPEAGGFAAKISYVKKVYDGWQSNVNPDSDPEPGSEDTDAFRLSANWDITDTFSAYYSYDRTESEAVSPMLHFTFSYGTPSSSAAIIDSDARAPPTSMVPAVTFTVPSTPMFTSAQVWPPMLNQKPQAMPRPWFLPSRARMWGWFLTASRVGPIPMGPYLGP